MRLAALFFMCFLAAASVFGQEKTAWKLVWADEFTQPNGSVPSSVNWTNDLGAGGWGNAELENYTSRTNDARIENGQLVIEARQENYLGSSYTSARLKTQGRFSWTYGRVEARIKIPRGQGIWPAFWMLGTNITSVNWPTCGEIDIMENIGREPALMHGTIHGPGYSGGGGISGAFALPGPGAFADDFHIYAIEWTTNQFRWFVDGLQYFSATPASLPDGTTWVYTQPQFLLLNLAVGGIWPGNPDGTTVFPQRMTVDYVRVYAPTNLSSCDGPNALANPGFDNGGFANWTVTGAGFNTSIENIKNVPVHDGSNVFKVFGQFTGVQNDSGVEQTLPATPGQSFKASGWAFSQTIDAITGANTAWIEASFLNSGSNTLALYRSALVNTNSITGVWLYLPVTNQLNPATSAIIGSVTNLVAPAGTSWIRYRAVLRQPATAAGAVLFDDLNLSAGSGVSEFPVRVSVAQSGTNLNLGFSTYLALPYQVQWKTNLTDPAWLVLTNLIGDGSAKTVSVDFQTGPRFYKVARICN